MASGGHRTFSFKVVLLGEGRVGKTSVILRYCENKFYDKHISTLQASFFNKKLNIAGNRVNLSIWDTAGQERFHALGPIYYRESNGAVLLYDITDPDSFQKVKLWVKELRRILGNEVCLCIVGNKTDLDKDRNVSAEEAERYAEAVGAQHHQTSAKLNTGIDQLFLSLCKRMMDAVVLEERSRANNLPYSGHSHHHSLQIVDSEQEETMAPRGSCCFSA
ncbi:ras-related protein Rab-21-like [Astyanax mexicanus]|uniref:Ras-related protein Rab-21 n=1 Tax=Astyanax mexicanus TaxID=7994 RepID=A0A8T2LTF9_ASTMX|nr:ras-related protein Rab-21-like [Astyanax mexicanus]